MKYLNAILIALLLLCYAGVCYEIGWSNGFTQGYIANQKDVIARLDELLDAKERMNHEPR